MLTTDVSEARLELAARMGADLAVDARRQSIADAQRRLGMNEGFDVGLEMSGSPSSLPQMIASLNHGGRVAMLGPPAAPIDIDWATVVTRMITINGAVRRAFATARSGNGGKVVMDGTQLD